jgi:dipeptidyl aminopeptidase/acylaminoacyl peptidase
VAREGRLIRLGKGGGTVLIAHDDARIVALLPAPADGAIAYALVRGADMELRLLPPGASDSRVLFTWAAMPLHWTWSPDGSRLFVALPGDWDWQLWDVALDGVEPRRLIHEAARIVAVAAAPDGHQVAVVAQSELDEPTDRTELFIIDDRSNDVHHIDEPAVTFVDAAWLDDASLVVITADAGTVTVPRARRLERLALPSGARSPF